MYVIFHGRVLLLIHGLGMQEVSWGHFQRRFRLFQVITALRRRARLNLRVEHVRQVQHLLLQFAIWQFLLDDLGLFGLFARVFLNNHLLLSPLW